MDDHQFLAADRREGFGRQAAEAGLLCWRRPRASAGAADLAAGPIWPERPGCALADRLFGERLQRVGQRGDGRGGGFVEAAEESGGPVGDVEDLLATSGIRSRSCSAGGGPSLSRAEVAHSRIESSSVSQARDERGGGGLAASGPSWARASAAVRLCLATSLPASWRCRLRLVCHDSLRWHESAGVEFHSFAERRGQCGTVRDDDQHRTGLGLQFQQEPRDRLGGAAVEVAGGLVGEQAASGRGSGRGRWRRVAARRRRARPGDE